MSALPQYNFPPPTPDPPRRRLVRRRNPHRATAAETGFKLGTNLVLAIVALSALANLIPYNLAQQGKLQEIRAEVSELEGRVDQLQANLSRQFDPQQAMSVMQEESSRVDPRQRKVVWVQPSNAMTQMPPSAGDEPAAAFYPAEPARPAELTRP